MFLIMGVSGRRKQTILAIFSLLRSLALLRHVAPAFSLGNLKVRLRRYRPLGADGANVEGMGW